MPVDRPRTLTPLSFLVLAAGAVAAPQDGVLEREAPIPELASAYGFAGMVISRLNDGVSNLRAADVDGDGRNDLVVVNNPKAKIELLIQPAPGETIEPKVDGDLVNELPDEVRYRREAYPIEEKVTAVAIRDVDGDGRPDLLFLGDSGKLTIAYRDAEGRYPRTVRIDVENASAAASAIQPADLDGDGRVDVAVLAKSATYLLMQDEGGGFAERRKLPNATVDPDGFAVLDLDGDGHLDLLYADHDSQWPFRYRLGAAGHDFGPEVASRFAEVRSFTAGDFTGDAAAEILAVRRRSGRLSMLAFGVQPAGEDPGELPLSSLRSVPFEELKDADQRDFLLEDLDGDGVPELLVTEPSAARVVVHRKLLGGDGSGATPYPSFVGASKPRLGDVDGDGVRELVVAAPAEGAIGVAEIGEGGAIGFPAALAVPGGQNLLALDVADTDGDGTAEIWVVVATDARGRSRERSLVRIDASGAVQAETALPDLKSDPNELMLADVNRDGRLDAIVFVPREAPTILLAGEAGRFTDLKAAQAPGLGILKGTTRGALAFGDVDGDGRPELLVPGPNFARAFHLGGGDATPQVVAQHNLPNPSADVSLVGFGDLDGAAPPEVLIVDKRSSALHVLRPGEGAPETVGRVDLTGLTPTAMRVTDLDGNGRADVLFLAADRYAVVQNAGVDRVFRVVADLEVPLKDAVIDQVAAGDVNGDGARDAVLTEVNSHLVAIAAIRPEALEYALRFRVFEERLFERGRGGREPREIVVAELTGDEKQDIAILVHDRVIVYPQE